MGVRFLGGCKGKCLPGSWWQCLRPACRKRLLGQELDIQSGSNYECGVFLPAWASGSRWTSPNRQSTFGMAFVSFPIGTASTQVSFWGAELERRRTRGLPVTLSELVSLIRRLFMQKLQQSQNFVATFCACLRLVPLSKFNLRRQGKLSNMGSTRSGVCRCNPLSWELFMENLV